MPHEHDFGASCAPSCAAAILERDDLAREPLDESLGGRVLSSANGSLLIAYQLASCLVRREDVRHHVQCRMGFL